MRLHHRLILLAFAIVVSAGFAAAREPFTAYTSLRTQAPQATGGPDHFGYTWDDSEPYQWIDATGGTALNLHTGADAYVSVNLPFGFTYYGASSNRVIVHYDGCALFQANSWPAYLAYPRSLPSPTEPNTIVTPYWSHFEDNSGTVYALSGGTAPDRWEVIEWNGMRDYSDPSSAYTFEAVFHENGDITFQYQNMTYGSSSWRAVTGIEDSTGYDGLMYQDGSHISAGTAIRFIRPAPAVRAFVYPPTVGSFVAMGLPQQLVTNYFGPKVFNSGELGSDTYDLTVNSAWNVTLDGESDTNGNGIPDTGTLEQQQSRTIYVDVDAPATPAASNTTVLTATSSLDPSVSDQVTIQAAVPARFMEAHGRYRMLRIATPSGTTDIAVPVPDEYGYAMPTVLELGNGNLLYTWTQEADSGNNYVDRIYCEILDRAGHVVVDGFRVDPSDDDTYRTFIWDVATAESPDGHVGIVWHQDRYDSSYNENDNVYLAVIDETGQVLVPAVNVTNNTAFGQDGDVGVPFIRYTKIAATADNRFVLAWQKDSTQSAGAEENVYTAIYDTAGTEIQGIVNRSGVAAGTGSGFSPGIGELSGNRVALAYSTTTGGQLEVHAINSDGSEGASAGLGIDGTYPDMTALAGGKLLVGFIHDGVTSFSILDSSLSLVAGPTALPNKDGGAGSIALSVTHDARGNGILVWEEDGIYALTNYAAVDSTGAVITPPTVFETDTSYSGISYNGSAISTYRPFGDVPLDSFGAGSIEKLLDDGVTAGCGTDTFCPGQPVTRAEMAVFLLKAEHGSSYSPPACTGVFADVACPGGFAVDWIEQLAAEGITAGCGNGDYCPKQDVKRSQMAVFLSKTMNLR